MQQPTHQRVAGHPAANEFADMLEHRGVELQPPKLTETASEKGDEHKAIKRMKLQKSADPRRFVAELMKYAPDIFMAKLSDGFCDLMTIREVPHDWRKNFSKCCQKIRSRTPSD